MGVLFRLGDIVNQILYEIYLTDFFGHSEILLEATLDITPSFRLVDRLQYAFMTATFCSWT